MTNPLRDELRRMVMGHHVPRDETQHDKADLVLAFIDQHYIPRASLESDEMVERAARALLYYECAPNTWDQAKEPLREPFICQARAVLAAIGDHHV